MPLETQIHTEQKSGREREGASVVIDQLFRSTDSCPPVELSADLLPLPVELHDVLQLHARRARCLDRRLEGEKRGQTELENLDLYLKISLEL